MEKLTIEQKVKAYDDAIKVIKDNLDALNEITETGANTVNIQSIINCFYRAFPELKKTNKNEKIKESIKKVLANTDFKKLGIEYSFYDMVNWLEKQGEKSKWKPSKDEMDVLYGLAYITNQYDEHKEEVVTRLYQDLKREFFNGSSYENMFPNTEDGVRRRSTIQVLEYARSLDTYNQYGKADIDKNIAWLEKQGEQSKEVTYTHEVETGNGNIKALVTEKVQLPKFKVGDWVVNNTTRNLCHIVKVEHGQYICDDCSFPINKENGYHLWSIADAKPGDVLVSPLSIFIFKRIYIANQPESYCAVMGDLFMVCPKGVWTIEQCYPATKEEQERLFSKMKESGYKWDVKNRELISLQQEVNKSEFNPDDIIEESYQQQADNLIDMVTKKPAWSDEDEYIMEEIEAIIDAYVLEENDPKALKNWLKSLKEYVQPQLNQNSKWKWDEDDEKFFKENILVGLGNADDVSEELYNKIIDWLNLIKK